MSGEANTLAKPLVAYFSATGTTARLAKRLAETLQADLFEIVPEQPYTAADLNWNDRQSRSTREMDDPNSRPVIVGSIPDLSTYSTVFVGFPIWWYTAPRIIKTFLEQCDLEGKDVVPFATSGGSSIGSSARDLSASAPGARMHTGAVLQQGNDTEIEGFIDSALS